MIFGRDGRVIRDKPGGLEVNYLGLADQLKKALVTYTESDGQGNPTFVTCSVPLFDLTGDKRVTIDWTLRERARATIKVMVKRILNMHGYPPDLQEAAVKTVLAHAELLCAEWV